MATDAERLATAERQLADLRLLVVDLVRQVRLLDNGLCDVAWRCSHLPPVSDTDLPFPRLGRQTVRDRIA